MPDKIDSSGKHQDSHRNGLGAVLAERRRPVSDMAATLIASLLVIPFLAGAVVGGPALIYHIVTQPNPSIAGVLIVIAGASLSAWAGWLALRRLWRGMHKRVSFHEEAMTIERYFRPPLTFRYDAIQQFKYAATRQYAGGAYIGTQLLIGVKDSARRLYFVTKHKEKPKGLAITVLGRRFEGEDELDTMANIIASTMAEPMHLAWNESPVIWCKRLTLSPAGIGRVGKTEAPIVPWSEVEIAPGSHPGTTRVARRGTVKSLAVLNNAEWNYLVGLEICRLMIADSGATS